jgi:bifunctional ADP-heptose synthase (sugar kinase/adenylyltransferase)
MDDFAIAGADFLPDVVMALDDQGFDASHRQFPGASESNNTCANDNGTNFFSGHGVLRVKLSILQRNHGMALDSENADLAGIVAEIVQQAHDSKRIVFVSGNFNVIHPGQRLLNFAAECGDFLIVGVTGDDVPAH